MHNGQANCRTVLDRGERARLDAERNQTKMEARQSAEAHSSFCNPGLFGPMKPVNSGSDDPVRALLSNVFGSFGNASLPSAWDSDRSKMRRNPPHNHFPNNSNASHSAMLPQNKGQHTTISNDVRAKTAKHHRSEVFVQAEQPLSPSRNGLDIVQSSSSNRRSLPIPVSISQYDSHRKDLSNSVCLPESSGNVTPSKKSRQSSAVKSNGSCLSSGDHDVDVASRKSTKEYASVDRDTVSLEMTAVASGFKPQLNGDFARNRPSKGGDKVVPTSPEIHSIGALPADVGSLNRSHETRLGESCSPGKNLYDLQLSELFAKIQEEVGLRPLAGEIVTPKKDVASVQRFMPQHVEDIHSPIGHLMVQQGDKSRTVGGRGECRKSDRAAGPHDRTRDEAFNELDLSSDDSDLDDNQTKISSAAHPKRNNPVSGWSVEVTHGVGSQSVAVGGSAKTRLDSVKMNRSPRLSESSDSSDESESSDEETTDGSSSSDEEPVVAEGPGSQNSEASDENKLTRKTWAIESFIPETVQLGGMLSSTGEPISCLPFANDYNDDDCFDPVSLCNNYDVPALAEDQSQDSCVFEEDLVSHERGADLVVSVSDEFENCRPGSNFETLPSAAHFSNKNQREQVSGVTYSNDKATVAVCLPRLNISKYSTEVSKDETSSRSRANVETVDGSKSSLIDEHMTLTHKNNLGSSKRNSSVRSSDSRDDSSCKSSSSSVKSGRKSSSSSKRKSVLDEEVVNSVSEISSNIKRNSPLESSSLPKELVSKISEKEKISTTSGKEKSSASHGKSSSERKNSDSGKHKSSSSGASSGKSHSSSGKERSSAHHRTESLDKGNSNSIKGKDSFESSASSKDKSVSKNRKSSSDKSEIGSDNSGSKIDPVKASSSSKSSGSAKEKPISGREVEASNKSSSVATEEKSKSESGKSNSSKKSSSDKKSSHSEKSRTSSSSRNRVKSSSDKGRSSSSCDTEKQGSDKENSNSNKQNASSAKRKSSSVKEILSCETLKQISANEAPTTKTTTGSTKHEESARHNDTSHSSVVQAQSELVNASKRKSSDDGSPDSASKRFCKDFETGQTKSNDLQAKVVTHDLEAGAIQQVVSDPIQKMKKPSSEDRRLENQTSAKPRSEEPRSDKAKSDKQKSEKVRMEKMSSSDESQSSPLQDVESASKKRSRSPENDGKSSKHSKRSKTESKKQCSSSKDGDRTDAGTSADVDINVNSGCNSADAGSEIPAGSSQKAANLPCNIELIDKPLDRRKEATRKKPVQQQQHKGLQSAEFYLQKAKQLKREGSGMKPDSMLKLLTYAESLLSFVCHCFALEQERQDSTKTFKMLQDTLKFSQYVCDNRITDPIPNKEKHSILVASYRLQSIVCRKLYRRNEVAKLKAILDDYNKSSSQPLQMPSPYSKTSASTSIGNPCPLGDALSPMSPRTAPSPAGSVASIRSSGSGDSSVSKPGSNPSDVTIPSRIHSILMSYLSHMNYILRCHSCWDLATDIIVGHQDVGDFYSEMDGDFGPVDLHSSISAIETYFSQVIHRIRFTTTPKSTTSNATR